LAAKPTTNVDIREWYLAELAKIPELNKHWKREGIALDERAKKAWKFRHDKRREARSFMLNAVEVKMLRERDVLKYGNANGPSFEFLLKQLKEEGLSENQSYQAIIKNSYRTNAGINRTLGF
jgi:hypothetical protein